MLKLLNGWLESQSDFELTELKACHQTADAHEQRGELRRKLWRRIASRLAVAHSPGLPEILYQRQFHSPYAELPQLRAPMIYEKEAAISEQTSPALQPQTHSHQRPRKAHAVEDQRHFGAE